MINYKELFEKSKEISLKHNLTQLELYQRFMFARILERISVSKYQNNFILKGGLLLSAMFGIDNRTTRDMDITIKGIDVSKEKMVEILNEILSIDLDDGVKFKVVKITDIREEDEYGGNKYNLVAKLDNLKVALEIDISTGDKITPRELNFEYTSLFENKKIYIDTYNMETILAEKIETILTRGNYNTRMKDFYDVYMFLTKLKTDINIQNLQLSIKNTFNRRASFDYLKDYEQILEGIASNDRVLKMWNVYTRKNKYANGLSFEIIITELKLFISSLELDAIKI